MIVLEEIYLISRFPFYVTLIPVFKLQIGYQFVPEETYSFSGYPRTNEILSYFACVPVYLNSNPVRCILSTRTNQFTCCNSKIDQRERSPTKFSKHLFPLFQLWPSSSCSAPPATSLGASPSAAPPTRTGERRRDGLAHLLMSYKF